MMVKCQLLTIFLLFILKIRCGEFSEHSEVLNDRKTTKSSSDASVSLRLKTNSTENDDEDFNQKQNFVACKTECFFHLKAKPQENYERAVVKLNQQSIQTQRVSQEKDECVGSSYYKTLIYTHKEVEEDSEEEYDQNTIVWREPVQNDLFYESDDSIIDLVNESEKYLKDGTFDFREDKSEIKKSKKPENPYEKALCEIEKLQEKDSSKKEQTVPFNSIEEGVGVLRTALNFGQSLETVKLDKFFEDFGQLQLARGIVWMLTEIKFIQLRLTNNFLVDKGLLQFAAIVVQRMYLSPVNAAKCNSLVWPICVDLFDAEKLVDGNAEVVLQILIAKLMVSNEIAHHKKFNKIFYKEEFEIVREFDEKRQEKDVAGEFLEISDEMEDVTDNLRNSTGEVKSSLGLKLVFFLPESNKNVAEKVLHRGISLKINSLLIMEENNYHFVSVDKIKFDEKIRGKIILACYVCIAD